MVLDDRPAVVQLGLKFAPAIPAFRPIMEDVSAESIEQFLDVLAGLEAKGFATMFVAEDRGGELRGLLAIGMIPNLMTGVMIAEEMAWFVDPEHRARFVGPRLLTAAIEWARSNGLKGLKMGAPAGTAVGAFYESQGFTPVETVFILVL